MGQVYLTSEVPLLTGDYRPTTIAYNLYRVLPSSESAQVVLYSTVTCKRMCMKSSTRFALQVKSSSNTSRQTRLF